ncbi:MAG: hypothetical protein JRI91_05520 [Deltaproteobacteria bacterium]|nr:hypothetical protein [Deltaproteobacteria bacterium]
MLKYFSPAITALIAALMLTGPINKCHAYVISGSHILDLMVQNIGTTKNLLVSQKVCLFETGHETDVAEYEEIVKYSFPEHFRSDIETKHGIKIHIFSADRYLTIINGNITSRAESLFTLYKDILLFRNRILLENRLAVLGVDTSVSSLGRYNGRISYIVGAKYPDESFPQVWFDHKTFRPFRYILPYVNNPENADYMEIIYLGWKKFDRIWYPERIEIYQGNTILQTIEMQSIEVNPILKEDIFDIDKAELLYTKIPEETKKTQEQQDDLNNVRQSIEEFRKRFEQ